MADSLDGDGDIEIVALSANNISTSDPRNSRNLKAFRGADGTTIRDIATPYISFDGQLQWRWLT